MADDEDISEACRVVAERMSYGRRLTILRSTLAFRLIAGDETVSGRSRG
jgi:hypothetical protein